MYKTICPSCNREAEIIYTFWIKKVKCPNCKNEIKLFKDYIITYDKKETEFYLVCPHCLNVFLKGGRPKEKEKCPNCNKEFSPFKGVVINNHVTCPSKFV